MPKQHINKGTALITGAAKRIGRAISLALSHQGYAIALHYNHSKSEAQQLAEELIQTGCTCTVFPCDLSNPTKTMNLISKVKKSCPDLNVLINSASIFEQSTIKKLDLVSLQKHMTINFEAPYILTSTFANHCPKGHIINILDTHIVSDSPDHANYLLSKKTLFGLTKMSAKALAPNIRVNGIAPGLILAPEKTPNDHLKRLADHIPMKREGSVEDIMHCISFLLNSSYITGQVIYVDGGEHLL